jgi:cysteinyl-tRNA synthetase
MNLIMKLTENHSIPVKFIPAAILILLLFISCTIQKIHPGIKTGPDTRLIYVLQKTGFKKLKNTEFEIAIVDPDDSKLSRDDLKILHSQNKILLAYLSIGEAEDYRDYWEDDWETGNPSFIDDENPDWDGNYKVRYWYKSWQEILFSSLDEIINLGYDGVYLDIIDAYQYYESKGFDSAGKEMSDLVINISKRSKEAEKDFLVIPQNAEELLIDCDYLSAIDGIGREDLWYIDNTLQDEKELETALQYLKIAVDSGKPVFAISYPLDPEKKCSFIKNAKEHNFIPYAGKRELDSIEITDCN